MKVLLSPVIQWLLCFNSCLFLSGGSAAFVSKPKMSSKEHQEDESFLLEDMILPTDGVLGKSVYDVKQAVDLKTRFAAGYFNYGESFGTWNRWRKRNGLLCRKHSDCKWIDSDLYCHPSSSAHKVYTISTKTEDPYPFPDKPADFFSFRSNGIQTTAFELMAIACATMTEYGMKTFSNATVNKFTGSSTQSLSPVFSSVCWSL